MNFVTIFRVWLWISVGALCLGAGLAWRWHFNPPPVRAADCVAVTGPLYSARQWAEGSQQTLDIHLRGNPLLFRVLAISDGVGFDPAIFRASAPPGTTITLQVRKSALQSPFHPPFSATPVVWADGLSDAHTVYYSITQARNRDIQNKRMGLYVAIIATTVSVGSLLALISIEIRGFKGPERPLTPQMWEKELRIATLQFFAGITGIILGWLINRYWHPVSGSSAMGYPLLLFVVGFFRMIFARRQLKKEKSIL